MGRLCMAEAIDAHQYEHVTGPFRQARDRTLQIERHPFAGGIGHVGQTRPGLRYFILDSESPAPGEYGVDGNAVQPGRESAALLEVPQRAPRSDEGFLGTVL